MRIAVDARELRGQPTGVGRFLRTVLDEWTRIPAARAHEFITVEPAHERAVAGIGWEQLVLPRLVRKARADVLFAPAYSGPLVPRVPMVVAIHDVSFAAHPEWFRWREGARRRTTARFAARAAARVITISEFSKREIITHLGVDESKIAVIYPGIADLKGPGRSDSDLSLAARTLRVREARTVLFVGSIFNRRHVPELIDGFARLAHTRPGMQLEVVGDNRSTPRVDLDALVRSTGIGDRIHLRSYVSDEHLRRLYAEASAFVFLSEYEGFGLTPLEAMASGVPVVLLDTPVAREVCGDGAVYVDRPDPRLVADALDAVLFDNDTRGRILNSAKNVLARYSWTTCAQQVLDVLVEAGSR